MIFDSHVHYNLEPLWSDWQSHWHQAQAVGVTGALVVGTNLETSHRALSLADQVSQFFASVGIHPGEYTLADFSERDLLVDQQRTGLTQLLERGTSSALTNRTKLVAIGEIGLDYFRLPSDRIQAQQLQQLQQQAFRMQLQLANQAQLPVILHVRDRQIPETPVAGNAYWDVLSTVQEVYAWHRPVILHCVSGPAKYVREFLSLGAYLGVAGNVTYKSADHIRELVKLAPQDRILLETDAPYLPPQSHRGQVCEPWLVSETSQFLATELHITPAQTEATARRVFGLLN